MERNVINLAAVLFWLIALTLPLFAWGVYIAVKRQASLRSIFIVIAAESVILAMLVALTAR